MVEIHTRFTRTESAFNVAAARARPPCDHRPEDTVDLSVLVTSFIERETQQISPNLEQEEVDSSLDEDLEDVNERLKKVLEGLSSGQERMRIMAAMEDVGDSSSKRQLMAFLRNKGFDAGLCKSKWERFGKNTAGKYEYVDVQKGGDHNRYIVETNLAGECKIARPTKRYLFILNQVPRVFVGTPEELKHLVRIMCHEMRRSMTQVGIHVPPWRRNGYMQAKWFGFYKRTTNEMGNNSSSSSVETMSFKSCCKEEFWKGGGMVGQLTIAFNV